MSTPELCKPLLLILWPLVGLLWVRGRPGTPLSLLAQGREVWKAGRKGRSASGAIPPLPQEPVRPHFAFALEGNRRGGWEGDWQAHWPNDGRGSGCLRRGLREGSPLGDPQGMVTLGASFSTFISTSPRSSSSKPPNSSRTALVSEDRWIFRAEEEENEKGSEGCKRREREIRD